MRRTIGAPSIITSILFLCFLLLPLIALVTSLTIAGMKTALSPSSVAAGSALPALWTSLRSTALVLFITISFGTPLAWTLARVSTPLRHTGELLLLIPLSIPPLVLGLLLISVYGPYGFIGARLGQFSQTLVNSFWGLCLAQFYEAAPAYVLAAQAGFLQVDHRLEQMSWLLGKNRWTTFRRITLPLAAPGLAAGFAFAVVRALGAFGAVLVIAYHPTSLPLAIWLGLEERGVPQALPIAAILLIVTVPFPLLATLWGYYAQRHANLPPAAL